jgi:hypothetical protein
MVSVEGLLKTNNPVRQLPAKSFALKYSVAGAPFSSYGSGTASTMVNIYSFNLRHTTIYKYNGKSCGNSARERLKQVAGSVRFVEQAKVSPDNYSNDTFTCLQSCTSRLNRVYET